MKKNVFILILTIILLQGVFGFVGKAEALGLVSGGQDLQSTKDGGSVIYSYSTDGKIQKIDKVSKDGKTTTNLYGGLFNSGTYSESVQKYNTSGGTDKTIFTQVSNNQGALATTDPNSGLTQQQQQDQAAQKADNQASGKKDPAQGVTPCFGWTTGFDFQGCAAQGSYIILWITARLLWVAGWLFNFTIDYSLNMGDFIKKVPIIDVGWKIFRDLANICFIFILLAIAISTILQIDGYDTKKMLVKVIIAALLLNFSLFFTQVVIDSSNILALQVYGKITGFANDTDKTAGDKGISQTFLKGLGMSGIYSAGGDTGNSGTGSVSKWFITSGNVLAISLGGATLILVTALVFLMATVLFIVRTVTLIFVMILSPLAFVARILPSGEAQFQKWLKTLLKESFFAPLYMLFIFIVVSVVAGHNIQDSVIGTSKNINLATFLTGNGDAVGTLYTFAVLIALMMGSLIVAKQMSTEAGGLTRKIMGGALLSGGAWLGRSSAGRFGRAIAKSDSRFAKPFHGIGNTLAKSSFDVRNTPLGIGGMVSGTGVDSGGGVGGYIKTREEADKKKRDSKNAAEFSRKKEGLNKALASGNSSEIQKALGEFSNSEYAKLGDGILSNQLVIDNSNSGQIKAATDEKNENINENTRGKIKEGRIKNIRDALKDSNPITRDSKLKLALKNLSPEEKANLPEDLLNNHLVYKNFGKEVREAIGKKDITNSQKETMVNKRKQDLIDGIASVPPDSHKIEAAIKNLKGDDIYETLSTVPGGFYDPTTGTVRDEIVDHLTEDQLKDLEKKLGSVERRHIGDAIRLNKTAPGYRYVRAGRVTPTGGNISSGDGYEQWQ